MRGFIDELKEYIVVLNSTKEIIYANKALCDYIGYKDKILSARQLGDLIQINDDGVLVQCKNGKFINGTCKLKEVLQNTEKYYFTIIEFNEDQFIDFKFMENFLNSVDYTIFIKDLNNKVLFVNDNFTNKRNIPKELGKSEIENKFKEEGYKDILLKNDDYVVESKNSCLYEEVMEVNEVKNYYEIKKYPILNNNGEVKYIGVMINEISFIKSVQLKVMEVLDLFEIKEAENIDIDTYQENIFYSLEEMFKTYFKSEGFNIWGYNKNTSECKPYFNNKLAKEVLRGRKKIYLTDEEVQCYIDGDFNKVKYCNNEYDYFGQKNQHYVIRYPIIHNGEFMALLTINYNDYPIGRVIENESMDTVCKKIAFIIKYMNISKELEEELIKNEEIKNELQTFLNTASDFVMKADNNNKIIEVSNSAINVLGWKREELLKMNVKDLIHPEEFKDTYEYLKIVRSKKIEFKSGSYMNRCKCKDGTYKWIRWGKAHYEERDKCILASGRDITREIEIEKKEKLLERSRQLEKIRNEFFANLSHELKTPLTLILSVVQILEQVSRDQKNIYNYNIPKYISILKQNSYRLLRLVNNMIDTTKLDSGFYNINVSNTNIIELVEDVVMSVVEYCEGNDIHLTFNTEVEEELIACDPEQIERIIFNLLSNAIKYTGAKGEIYVDISLDYNEVIIKVKDTGIGISEENLECIFERFVQCDKLMTRRCEGSGIGLSLVKSLVELHNGSVSVESAEGIGSTFEVRLPRVLIDEEESDILNDSTSKECKFEKCIIEFSDIYALNQ